MSEHHGNLNPAGYAEVVKALEEAARSLEWIASHSSDEPPSSVRAYADNRAKVARGVLAWLSPRTPQDAPDGEVKP